MINFYRKKIALLYILLIMFSSLPTPAFSEVGGTLVVEVYGSTQPVPNIRVVVNSLVVAGYDGSGFTNDQGVTEIVNIPIGEYEVLIIDGAGNRVAENAGIISYSEEIISLHIGI